VGVLEPLLQEEVESFKGNTVINFTYLPVTLVGILSIQPERAPGVTRHSRATGGRGHVKD
jgi:hypothetical protein